MSTPVTYIGTSYSIPAYNDSGYAQGAGNLSSYLIALATGSLTLSGGAFTLTADANFGGSFGLIALYLKSTSANLPTAGILRLAVADTIAWRNNANNGNLLLAVNASNQLTFNGTILSQFGIPLPIADGGTNSTTALSNGLLMASAAGAIVESAITISTAALGAISSITSATANAASAGVLRLANTEGIDWRNNANNANLALAKNASDQLSYAGTVFLGANGVVLIGGGGTNSSASLANGKLMASSAGAIVESAIGTTVNGSGNLVGTTSASLVTPTLGAALATSINFGDTSLANYKEGTWTPTDGSGASLSLTVTYARYTRIGRIVYIDLFLSYPANANASATVIAGLPFTAGVYAVGILGTNAALSGIGRVGTGGTTISLLTIAGNVGITNTQIASSQVFLNLAYTV